ncbi:MAG: response regulator transcription factor [Lachnospiraceae bacterium]|nr:response regulator transcription factor [Lachnospiraceae bacterium]
MSDILIVEDNQEIGALTADFLRKEGYSVSLAGDGAKALALYEMYGAKLVLLDIMLPGLDGFTICSKIRETSNTPIIIMSAKSGKEDKLNGLMLGADDYIEKPVDIDLLVAKIKGIFKRRFGTDNLSKDGIVLNRELQTLTVNGEPKELTGKEFELLKILMENHGTTLKKDYLFNTVWGSDSDSELQTLTVHMKRLREKIEADPKNPKHLITVWGVGYRFE